MPNAVFDTVIRRARVVTGAHSEVADVAIRDGKIAGIGDFREAETVIEAVGLILIPGLIDTQVHFREPGLTHKEDLATGTLAARHGGVTSVLEMPNTNPTTTTPEALADKQAMAAGRAACHYGFFFGATPENAERLAEYEILPGTPGIKVFSGSSTGSLLVSEEADLRRVFEHGRRRIAVHSENEARNRQMKAEMAPTDVHQHPMVRDAESAIMETRRILGIAKDAGRPVHILHISTGQEPAILAEAKRHQDVTCEVTPQHLWFAAPEAYDRLGTRAQMNPPIRSAEHREQIWRALEAGVFDVFGSDHAPHLLSEKALPYPASPSGMPGVETMLAVLLTFVAQGRLSLETVVRMACETPARLYGITGKGHIRVGYDADLVLLDPSRAFVCEAKNLHSRCGWTPYEGETLFGEIHGVFLNGDREIGPEGRQLRFDGLEG
jgi:dihydroorotase